MEFWFKHKNSVKFYPLTHRILAKTKKSDSTFFSECKEPGFAKKSRIWFIVFAKIRWVKG